MNIKKLKIVYFGTPEISARVMERLIKDGYNIVALVTQEDKPQGRKNIITPSACKEVALKYNIPVFQPHKIRLDYNFLKLMSIDVILTLSYGQIVPHEVLELPVLGCYNLHGSILPKYRGAAPIQYALMNGEKETGVTLMKMVDKMDAGKIYAVSKFKIEETDNYTSLCMKISNSAYDVFVNNIDDVLSKKNSGEEQNEKEVTFTGKIESDKELIDFNMKAEDLKNLVRALSYNPGMFFNYKNEKIKVYQVEVVDKTGKPGEIIEYFKDKMIVGCGEKAILIKEIQRAGKRMMNMKDFYNGNLKLFKIGDIITK